MATKGFCLLKPIAEEFVKRLKSGDISPAKLNAMESAERRKFFETFMDKDAAKETNLLFEKKLTLKDQERGLIRWAEQLSGVTMKQREEVIEKIRKTQAERLKRTFSPEEEDSFLNELVDSRLGIGVSEEESRLIFELAGKIENGQELFQKNKIYERIAEIRGSLSGKEKSVIDKLFDKLDAQKSGKELNSKTIQKIKRYLSGSNPSEETKAKVAALIDDILKVRKDADKYGAAKIALDDYVGEIKLGIKEPMSVGRSIIQTSGFLKSLKASFDNSFILRQGLKTLASGHPIIWAKTMVKSFELLAKSLGGKEALKGLRASTASRVNSMNGTYDRMGLAVGITEEAYPTTLPERLPFFGRLFKASQEAFTGSAYYMRAELADALIAKRTAQGVDLNDKAAAESLGILINSMTGRGTEGLGKLGEKTNVLLFSPKFLQSNIDFLTAHSYSSKVTRRDKLEAAKNLVSMIATVGGTLYLADKFMPGSVEWDPRSSDFGKIRIGNTRIDVTGGMGSFVTLIARMGGIKNTTTGVITGMREYGGKGVAELVAAFTENKVSPFVALMVDLIEGEDFDRNPLTIEAMKEDPTGVSWRLFKNAFFPIPLQNIPIGDGQQSDRFKSHDMSTALMLTVLDGLGASANTYGFTNNWNVNTGVTLQGFKDKVGNDTFIEENKKYSEAINSQLLKLRSDERFKSKSPEEKQALIERLKELEKQKIFDKYKYVYKRAVDKKSTSERNDLLKDYGYKVK